MATFGQPVFVNPGTQYRAPDFSQIFTQPLAIASQIQAARRNQIAADIAAQMAPIQLQNAQANLAYQQAQLKALQDAPAKEERLFAQQLLREGLMKPGLGLEAIERDITVPLAEGASLALTPEQQLTLEQSVTPAQETAFQEAGIPLSRAVVPTKQATFSIPVPGAPGVAISQSKRAAELARELQYQTQLAEAKRRESPVIPTGFSNGKYYGFDPNKGARGELVEIPKPEEVTGPLAPKTVTAKSASGLTPYQEATFKVRGAKLGVSPSEPKYTDPETKIFNEDAFYRDLGEAERQDEVRKIQEKQDAVKAKPLPIKAAENLADAKGAVKELIALKLNLPSVRDISGPVVGRTLGIIPTDVQAAFQGVRGITKQKVGKFLEGGVLREADERKYEEIVPGLKMSPEVQNTQNNELYRSVREKLVSDMEAYQKAGYPVDEFLPLIAQIDAEFQASGGVPPPSTVPSPTPTPTTTRPPLGFRGVTKRP